MKIVLDNDSLKPQGGRYPGQDGDASAANPGHLHCGQYWISSSVTLITNSVYPSASRLSKTFDQKNLTEVQGRNRRPSENLKYVLSTKTFLCRDSHHHHHRHHRHHHHHYCLGFK